MKKNKIIIIFVVLAVIMLILALILFSKNKDLSEHQIKIINASYGCNNTKEIFYEEDSYVYSFPCVQSNNTYVKFANGDKMLVVDALQEEKVTIDELVKAGLDIIKDEK